MAQGFRKTNEKKRDLRVNGGMWTPSRSLLVIIWAFIENQHAHTDSRGSREEKKGFGTRKPESADRVNTHLISRRRIMHHTIKCDEQ